MWLKSENEVAYSMLRAALQQGPENPRYSLLLQQTLHFFIYPAQHVSMVCIKFVPPTRSRNFMTVPSALPLNAKYP
ncbi:hypothetical protein BH09BAC1_BH09BAC1_02920 [soil metagenome]